jgi:hypothetical protein
MGGSVLQRSNNRTYSIYHCNRNGCDARQAISAPAAEEWAMGEAQALHASLVLRPVGGNDGQLERAHAALEEATTGYQ